MDSIRFLLTDYVSTLLAEHELTADVADAWMRCDILLESADKPHTSNILFIGHYFLLFIQLIFMTVGYKIENF